MTSIYRKENSEPFTESAATSSGVGSKGWDYEQKTEARQQGRSMTVTSANGPARSRERTFTSGTGTRRASNSTGWATHEQMSDFSVRESGMRIRADPKTTTPAKRIPGGRCRMSKEFFTEPKDQL